MEKTGTSGVEILTSTGTITTIMTKSMDCLEKVHKIRLHKDLIAYALENSIQVSDLHFNVLHSYQTGSPAVGLEWSPQSGNSIILAASFVDRIVLFSNTDVYELAKISTNAISFNGNGSLLASTGDDKMARVHYIQEDTEAFQIPLRSRGVSIQWNMQNSLLLMGESNGDIRIFDFYTKQFTHSIVQPYFGQPIVDLCWGPSDHTFGGIVGDKWFLWNVEKSNVPEHQGYCLNGRKFIWNNHPSRIFTIQGLNDVKLFATVFTKGIHSLISTTRDSNEATYCRCLYYESNLYCCRESYPCA
jgi:WD40 repeat protein